MWADRDAQDSFEWEIGEQSAVIRFTRDGREYVQQVALTFTPCRFGGRRAWFLCPSCGRRVGKVYLPCSMYNGRGQRVAWFRCRFCYGLTYEQRRERDRYWTFLHRAERIAERWFADVTDEMLYRPKGLHWRTFVRRVEQYNALIKAANGCAMRSLLRFVPGWPNHTSLP